MIASPSDVIAERDAVRDVIHDWNSVHAQKNGVVLLPVGWETHAAPELGQRGQQLINDRVLTASDLLVGIFWQRLGSPTGEYSSGSVEEIQRHLKSGKPVMVYFSTTSAAEDDDEAQRAALNTFRAWCHANGLVRTFGNAAEFEKKFAHDLQLELYQNQYLRGLAGAAAASSAMGTPAVRQAPAGSTLLEQSRQLLIEAAKVDGVILKARHLSGVLIQAGGRPFGDEGDPRSMARWERALDELVDQGLVVAQGNRGEVFKVSDRGYELADKLRAQSAGQPGDVRLEPLREQILSTLAQGGRMSANKIAQGLGIGWQLATFHLEEMLTPKLVIDARFATTDGMGTEWSIAQAGRAYLVSHGLLK